MFNRRRVKVPYVRRLIGNLEPGKRNEEGKLWLPQVVVNRAQIEDPERLVEEYGTLGRGLEYILGNANIAPLLLNTDFSEFAIDTKELHGLDRLVENERKVLEDIIIRQHKRNQMLYRLASSDELQDYDNVTKGVIKGTILGATVGAILSGAQYLVGASGVSDYSRRHIGVWLNESIHIATDLVARIGPGFYEATAISHEVLEKENNGQSEPKHFGELFVEAMKELPRDAPAIAKTVADKRIWYDAVNVGGIVDKVKGEQGRERLEGYTQEWSSGQESGAARGTMMKAGTMTIGAIMPIDEYHIIIRALYKLADAIATAYINVGNNLQGGTAVYKKLVEDARKSGSLTPYRDAAIEFMQDPFQVTNAGVVLLFNSVEIAIRSLGIAPEELFEYIGARPLGAGIESSVLSWDTAVAAQLSKITCTYLVTTPAKKSVNPYNLMNLALEHDATNLQQRLMAYPAGRKAFIQYQNRAT